MRIPCIWTYSSVRRPSDPPDHANGDKDGLLLFITPEGGSGYAYIAQADGTIASVPVNSVRIKMARCFSRSITAAVKP